MSRQTIIFRDQGLQEYMPVWQAMQDFNTGRNSKTVDEIWLLQHPPVYTLGQNGKPEHLLNKNNIPLIHIDRGGQITYHGPGQLVIYCLLDLGRLGYGIRDLVTRCEQSLIQLLVNYNIEAESRPKAPGVYVNQEKIAALGFRVKRHCTYHGLAINVDMDLQPFNDINPCGYPNLNVTQLKDLGVSDTVQQVMEKLKPLLVNNLYNN